eukprot:scaffold6834_cov113-Skeletonema_dohrnii-CCMP3373.AAC.3
MTTLRGMYDNYFEARARNVNLEDITSSENNAFILERLRNSDDAFKAMGITGDNDDWLDENNFVVREGDSLGWLGYFIGKSERLESLWVSHLPGDDSFRQGLAQNQSIQSLCIYSDLREAGGFQNFAPFFRNTKTLKELFFGSNISLECAQNIALLLSRCQMKSLKSIEFGENEINDEGLAEVARALSMQPQLEKLDLTWTNSGDTPFRRGYAALGATMKGWKSPSLKKLYIFVDDIDDDGLQALADGMSNCYNLEDLVLGANDSVITEVGLRALSALLRSKKICLQWLSLGFMNIDDDGITALADGLASLQSLKSLNLSFNDIGDEGLQALAASLANSDIEKLDVSCNGSFSDIGLRCLSDVLPTALNLKSLNLGGNSINGEGLHALAGGLTKTSSLRWLNLANNAIDDEALQVLVEGMENLRNIETLSLSGNRVTASGLSVLTPIFHRDSCSLKEIDLDGMDIGDEGAEVLAEGLRGNKSLTKLMFDCTDVTDMGWSAFSRLLCDTSSVNNTYLSNHTLEVIGCRFDDQFNVIPSSVKHYFKLNKQNQHDVTICKILMSHADLDMTPFFQWKLKLLPLVVAWLERARSCRAYVEESITSFERRELSSVYQFIRGLPLLVVDGFYKQKSTHAHSKKRKFDQRDK